MGHVCADSQAVKAQASKRKAGGEPPAPAPPAPKKREQPTSLPKTVTYGKEAEGLSMYEFVVVERTPKYSEDPVLFDEKAGSRTWTLAAWAEDYNDALSIAGAEDLVECECPGCKALMPEEDWDFCALHLPCARCYEPMQRGDPEDYCEECQGWED